MYGTLSRNVVNRFFFLYLFILQIDSVLVVGWRLSRRLMIFFSFWIGLVCFSFGVQKVDETVIFGLRQLRVLLNRSCAP